MSSEIDPCGNLSATSTNQNNSRSAEDHPFSSSLPAFTAINRRRRVTCKNCHLPVGYVDIGLTHLEAMRCGKVQKYRTSSDDPSLESITIPCPINVSLTSKRLGPCKTLGSENHFMTWIVEDSGGNALNVDEIICDGCGSSLGARVTPLKQTSPSTEEESCESVKEQEEKSHWYRLSLERVEIEPFFGIVGLRELSTIYYGGERYFSEIEAIEDSDVYSNNSASWMRPHERVDRKNSRQGEISRNAWPLLLMDLVRVSELPEGTLGHLGLKKQTLPDNLDAFTLPPPDRGIDDVSVTHYEKCCTEIDKNAEMANVE
ncbi:hypothetical protein Aperf_G00000105096 [Anoplocephala perfoliata]